MDVDHLKLVERLAMTALSSQWVLAGGSGGGGYYGYGYDGWRNPDMGGVAMLKLQESQRWENTSAMHVVTAQLLTTMELGRNHGWYHP